MDLLHTGNMIMKFPANATVNKNTNIRILSQHFHFVEVNCSRSALESIATNNQNIELLQTIGSLSYGTQYRWKVEVVCNLFINIYFSSFKCKTFGKQFNISTGFLYFKTVECQEDKTWTNFDLPCECKNLLKII